MPKINLPHIVTDPFWDHNNFQPRFGVVNGVLIEWKGDHWEDEQGNTVTLELQEQNNEPISGNNSS